MNRREFLCGMAAGMTTARAAARPPNILFLFTDDQRFDTIHALGNNEVRTPNMDRLAREGTAFTRACIMGGTIGAVCAPSRAMLMTGQTLFHVHDSIVAPREAPARPRRPFDLFPELLRGKGYATFGTGKWHNGERLFARCFSSGENIFFGGMSDHLRVPVADFDPSGQYPKEKRHTGEKFSSELFADSVIRFLKQHRGPQPFLAYAAFTAPHDPRMAPKEFADLYPPEKMELPRNFMAEHPFDNGELKIRDEQLAPWPRTPDEIRRHIAAYYGMITHVDAQIGRVLDALEQTGHARDTIVIFAADNGLAVGRHGLLGKQNLYDHSVRVPLIIGGPGLPRGHRCESLCYLLDLFPTICDLTGIPAPQTVEGRSLAPLIKDPRRRLRDSVFLAYRDVQRAVRTEDWKLIRYHVNGRHTTQLFDVREDPWEMHSMADRSPHRVSELDGLLRDWQRRVDDPAAA